MAAVRRVPIFMGIEPFAMERRRERDIINGAN
jgi:hypothetical protein